MQMAVVVCEPPNTPLLQTHNRWCSRSDTSSGCRPKRGSSGALGGTWPDDLPPWILRVFRG